jgi:hypothetical protein
MGEDTQEAQ